MTDQDRRQLRDDAKAVINKTAMRSSAAVSIAQYVLATVEPPAPTLSERLWDIADHWEEWDTAVITGTLTAAADRAEELEADLIAARADSDNYRRDLERQMELTHQATQERDLAIEDRAMVTADLKRASARIAGLVAEVDHLKSDNRRPMVTTVEELDALPRFTIVCDRFGQPWFRGDPYTDERDWWYCVGHEEGLEVHKIRTPATILHNPKETA